MRMEAGSIGESIEEKLFFTGTVAGPSGPRARPLPQPTVQQMESMGFGDSLEERMFFTRQPSPREPMQVARFEAREAAAGLLHAFVARGLEDQAHCERLAVWARRLAREVGLPSERLLDVELAALLHDVGYISLPEIDLDDQRPLTRAARSEMQRHPEMGAAILRGIPALRRAANLVSAHHEHFDGTGYPRGLRGGNIPVEARIIHLVDAYDALTHDRPHRARCSDAAAREEIAAGVGTHFDPEIHAAFLSVEPAAWLALVANIV
jgi:putative nucleotidyltransferase with HDIG domain